MEITGRAPMPSTSPSTGWEGCPVVVTGASGGVGSFLVRHLARLGARVRALDVIHDDHIGAFAEAEAGGAFEFVQLDICGDGRRLREALQGVQVVFHTVAHMGSPAFAHPLFEDPGSAETIRRITVGGTARVLDAAIEGGVAAFVHTSSANVVFCGEPLHGAAEDVPYPPPEMYVETYSRAKAEAERLVLQSNGRRGLRCVSIRPNGVWGPSEKFTAMVKLILWHAVVGGIWNRWTSRHDPRSAPLMDWTHVDNLCRAEVLAAERLLARDESASGECYNVTDARPCTLGEGEAPLARAARLHVARRPVVLPGALLAPALLCVEALLWLPRRLTGLGALGAPSTYPEVVKGMTTNYFSIEKARRSLGFEPAPHGALQAEAQGWVRDWADRRFHVPGVHPALWATVVPGLSLAALLACADVRRLGSLPWVWARALLSWVPGVAGMPLERFQRQVLFAGIFAPALGVHALGGLVAAAVARRRGHLLWRVCGFRGFLLGYAQLRHLASPGLAGVVGLCSAPAFAAVALAAARFR